ncbi:hypothetical protein SAMN02745898_109148 [Streptomyces sp. 136MFCol5.1]|uniref:hypothetical protein n=1 Tax=Streptomyces sp. 136MFCol5.1 TaxID=1172182 RepID=UPI000881B01B|nr:hypothetical protein [Streptomyces sp. 136MFCol5.1]SCZ09399.1 hypothetical protein SAMN02745898_109148 [Streptomyces sp. 136MFCol5.1]
MVQKPETDIEPKERRIDLNVPQVAGSAVAAVAAAVAASQLGVYGTILGAGVMSVVATCGGSVFQHFFRRTGEQIREVTVYTRETRDTRGAHGAGGSGSGRRLPDGSVDATTLLRTVTVDPGRTQLLEPLAGDATRPLASYPAYPDEEFTASTTHGTRIRGWKRPVLGAVAVFAVSMAGITTYELISGNDLSGGQGTTVGSVVRGGAQGPRHDGPAPSVGGDPGQGLTPGQESGGTPGTDPQDGQSRSPDAGQGDRPTTEPTPTPTPSRPGGDETAPAATPTPTPSGGDGSSVAPDSTGSGIAPGQEAPATTGTDSGR